jgi:hypothetical protein
LPSVGATRVHALPASTGFELLEAPRQPVGSPARILGRREIILDLSNKPIVL